jgi:hypothetical protein
MLASSVPGLEIRSRCHRPSPLSSRGPGSQRRAPALAARTLSTVNGEHSTGRLVAPFLRDRCPLHATRRGGASCVVRARPSARRLWRETSAFLCRARGRFRPPAARNGVLRNADGAFSSDPGFTEGCRPWPLGLMGIEPKQAGSMSRTQYYSEVPFRWAARGRAVCRGIDKRAFQKERQYYSTKVSTLTLPRELRGHTHAALPAA